MGRKQAFQIGATAGFALVAALVAGLLEQQIAESPQFSLYEGPHWNQTVSILLVPAAFGSVAMLLPGGREGWLPMVVIAGFASASMAYVVGREFVDGLDEGEAEKFARRAWYGVLYFSGGMLLPLTVTIGRLLSRQPPTAR